MAGPSCAGDASFHRSFDSDSDDDFFGFSTSDVEESRQRIRQGNSGELLTFIRDSDDEDGVDFEVHDRDSEVESSDGQPVTMMTVLENRRLLSSGLRRILSIPQTFHLSMPTSLVLTMLNSVPP